MDYWGEYSDLYSTLSVPEVEVLEKAIRARKLGRLNECRAILDKELPPSHLLPILAIEKSLLEARLGFERSRAEVLDKVLESQSDWREKPIGNEVKLLKILRAEAQAKAYGTSHQALAQARSLKEGFGDFPLETWTDIEVGCAVTYFTILKDCQRWSNWIDPEKDPYFARTVMNTPSAGVEAVTEFLVKANKLSCCLNLLRIEAYSHEQSGKLNLYLNFMEVCESRLFQASDKLSLVLLNCRLFFIEALIEMNDLDTAKEQLSKAGMELEALPWISTSDQQKQMLRKLQVDVRSSMSMDDLPDQLEIAAMTREKGDRLLESQTFATIFLTLNQVDQLNRDSAWSRIYDTTSSRYSELHSDPRGNVELFCAGLCRLGHTLDYSSYSNAGSFLFQLAKFDSTFPDFDIPVFRRDLYRAAALASRLLGKNEDAQAYEEKKMSALSSSPLDPSQFFRTYRDKAAQDWAPYVFEIILSWIKPEIEKKSLSTKDVIALLLLTHLKKGDEEAGISFEPLLHEIQTLSPAILVNKLYGELVPVGAEEWGERFQRYERWLWGSPSNVDRPIRHTVLGDIQEARCASVMKYYLKITTNSANALDEDLQLEMRQLKLHETARLLELRKRLDQKAMGSSPENIFSLESQLMGNRNDLSTSLKAFRTGLVKDDDILEVQNWKEAALSRLQSHQRVNRLAALSSIALCMRQRYTLFGTVAADACLDTFSRYDELYTEQRSERSILRGSDNIIARAEILSRWSFTNHYDFAMGMCVEALGVGQVRNNYHRTIHQDMSYCPIIPPPIRAIRSLFNELINWTQMKKARSVTEVLGAEVIIPKKALLAVEDDPDAQGLLQKELDLQVKLEKGFGDLIEVNKALNRVRSDMRGCLSLKQIMDMRDGLAMTEPEIQSLGKALGPNVLIVDYVYLSRVFTGLINEIIPMIYKNGQLCNAFFVGPNLDRESLQRWARTYMEEEKPLSTEDATAALKMLFPLIEAAVKFSEPGDTILLCPTDVLFGIPLHAIDVGGQLLIERNPVVYTQSLSILRLCQFSASSLDASEAVNPLAIQALSETDSALPTAPSMAFVGRLGARLLTGPELTKRTLIAASADSLLMHFYGHVGFNEKEPLDHYMAIRGLESERLTAREIFNTRFRSGAHVSLIGCGSGRSRVGLNDDLLGLSTALFYAGAGSIVSASWSIQMEDGDAFQEAFYDELLRQSSERAGYDAKGAVVDMATAVQKAVLRMSLDEDGARKAPYYWAAFTVQGCWNKFPILKVQDEKSRDRLSGVQEHTDRRRCFSSCLVA